MPTYYVSTTGSDTADGLTLQTAMSEDKRNTFVFQPGDTVFLFRGQVYNKELTVTGSGAAGSPITYDAVGTGLNPLVSRYKTLSGWVLQAGNIWYVPFNVDPRNIIVKVDGVIRDAGRWPKTDFKEYPAGGVGYINGPDVAEIPFDPVGAEVVTRPLRYTFDRNIITTRSDNNLEFSGGNGFGYNEGHKGGGKAFFIQQHIATLTADGHWFYDSAAKRMYMYFSGDPSARSVVAGSAFYSVYAGNKSYITFRNINHEGSNLAGFYAENCDHFIFDQCDCLGGVGGDFYSMVGGTHTITQGFTRGALNNGISAVNCNSLTVDGVRIENTGLIAGAGKSGVLTYSGIMAIRTKVQIANSSIKNTGYASLNIQCNDFDIHDNSLELGTLNLDDGGGIYLVDPDNVANKTNKFVRHNIVRHMPGAVAHTKGELFPMAVGGYGDNFMSDVTWEDNTFYSGGWTAALINAGKNNKFLNNNFFDFDLFAFAINRSANFGNADVSGNVITGNTFFCKTSAQAFYKFYTQGENPGIYGQFDHNTYIRPLNNGPFAVVDNMLLSFEQWRLMTGQDLHSKLVITHTANVDNIRFDFNDTQEDAVIPLEGIYVDGEGNVYEGQYVVAPFSGRVLVRKVRRGRTRNGIGLKRNGKGRSKLIDPS